MNGDDGHPLLVLGAGGHARVLVDALQCRGARIEGILDPGVPTGEEILGVRVLGGDELVGRYDPAEVRLVNLEMGASVIRELRLGTGCVIGAGATVLRDVAAGERYLGFGQQGDA